VYVYVCARVYYSLCACCMIVFPLCDCFSGVVDRNGASRLLKSQHVQPAFVIAHMPASRGASEDAADKQWSNMWRVALQIMHTHVHVPVVFEGWSQICSSSNWTMSSGTSLGEPSAAKPYSTTEAMCDSPTGAEHISCSKSINGGLRAAASVTGASLPCFIMVQQQFCRWFQATCTKMFINLDVLYHENCAMRIICTPKECSR